MTEPYLNISSNITNTSFFFVPNSTDDSGSYFEDLERSVSISVFILFGFIFIAGLIGNGLVVLGKNNNDDFIIIMKFILGQEISRIFMTFKGKTKILECDENLNPKIFRRLFKEWLRIWFNFAGIFIIHADSNK